MIIIEYEDGCKLKQCPRCASYLDLKVTKRDDDKPIKAECEDCGYSVIVGIRGVVAISEN